MPFPLEGGMMLPTRAERAACSFTALCRHFRSEAWLQSTNTGGFGSTF